MLIRASEICRYSWIPHCVRLVSLFMWLRACTRAYPHVPCTLYTVLYCTVLYCTVYCVPCTRVYPPCTVYRVLCTMHTCVPPMYRVQCTVYSAHVCTPTPNQPPLYSCWLERTTITEAVACETVQLIRTPDYQSSRGDTEDTSNVNGQNKVSIITYIFGQQQYKLQNKASIITIYFWIRTM